MDINSPFSQSPEVEKHDVMLVIHDMSDNSFNNSHYTSDRISQEDMLTSKKINHQINELFTNVSSNQKYTTKNKMFHNGVFENNKPEIEPLKALTVSPLTNGMLNEAMSSKNNELTKVGSDYYNLYLIKRTFDKVGDEAELSDKAYKLLDRYNIEPKQLQKFDADILLDKIKENPPTNIGILDQNKKLMVETPKGTNEENGFNVTQNVSERYIDTQRKVNARIEDLFENVNSNERFVTNIRKESKEFSNKELQTSPISNGTIITALKSPSFLTENSDYIDLYMMKHISKEFDGKAQLSNEANGLLKKYDLTLEGLQNKPDHELRDMQKNLSVNNITTKTDSFVIHTIATGFSISDNSPLKDGVSKNDRVEILRGFNPEICCSTIQRGVPQTANDFGYSDVGAIIGSGMITHASTGDAGSRVDRDGNRKTIGKDDLQSSVESVIKERQPDDNYNEILVKNPSIAGLYISFDKDQTFNESKVNYTDVNSPEKLIEKIKMVQDMANDKENPLPVFAIINGQVRDVHFNIDELSKYTDKNNSELRSEWKKMSDEELFSDKFMKLGHEYGPNDLSNYSKRNELSNERKIELVEKNQSLLKDEISNNKLDELYGVNKKTEVIFSNSKKIDNLFDNDFGLSSKEPNDRKNRFNNGLTQ